MIFRKMGCLVVTSNLVKLKSISSWPNFRAKTTENHFRFHFHFKWLPALESRREREREREGERKKRSRHHRHRAFRRHHWHRANRDRVKLRSRSRERVDRDSVNASIVIARSFDRYRAMRQSRSREALTAPIAISPSFVRIWWFFFWVLFVFWGINDII